MAGTNGAGKSSIAGLFLRRSGGDYFNPDEVARRVRKANPRLSTEEANSQAWHEGVRQIRDAIRLRREHFFETTLGGSTIPGLLEAALDQGLEVRVWYAGLDSPQRHLARVAARVRAGGHAIPENDIRRRYDASRVNLVRLLPRLTELRVFDNSLEADPGRGGVPKPRLVLHWCEGRVQAPDDLAASPEWAKPIVAAALKTAALRRHSRRRPRQG